MWLSGHVDGRAAIPDLILGDTEENSQARGGDIFLTSVAPMMCLSFRMVPCNVGVSHVLGSTACWARLQPWTVSGLPEHLLCATQG